MLETIENQLSSEQVAENICLHSLCAGMPILVSVWLVFLVQKGFDLTIVVLAEGIFRLTVVVMEFTPNQSLS